MSKPGRNSGRILLSCLRMSLSGGAIKSGVGYYLIEIDEGGLSDKEKDAGARGI